MPILPTIQGPADLRGLNEVQLAQLAVEIRETIIRTVAHTGGHLGSSLGVVELTIALHRLLESPRDRIVWDTGHQAYPHKLLTGRLERVRHAPPARRRRRLPASLGIAARRVRRRPRRHRAVDRRGPRRGARPAPRPRADRGRRRRRGADERAVARGAQRHRPPPDADADRRQRQRDVDQPDGRRVLASTSRRSSCRGTWRQGKSAYDRDGRADPGRRRDRPRAQPARSAGSVVQFAQPGPAVRGPRDHLHRRRARVTTCTRCSRRWGARSTCPGPTIVHVRTQKGRGFRPAETDQVGLPRRGAAADRRWRPAPTRYNGEPERRCRPSRWPTTPRRPRGSSPRPPKHPNYTAVFAGRADRAGPAPTGGSSAITAGMPTGTGHGQVPGRVPGPVLRRRDRRAALGDARDRAGDGRHAPGRRALLDVPPAGLRPDRPRRLPERPAGADRRRPGRPGRRGRHEPPGDVHAAGPAPAAEPRHRLARRTSRSCARCCTPRSPRTTRSRCTTRATPGFGLAPVDAGAHPGRARRGPARGPRPAVRRLRADRRAGARGGRRARGARAGRSASSTPASPGRSTAS